ncbi:hypothetical protein WKR98_18225 [Pigmentiphaga sp. YJ18]|uniref:hypothetical protein n=1 Tax=Pigmentiphaga sp. YJ18 TaxID=3134907 RepID=UPI00310DD076
MNENPGKEAETGVGSTEVTTLNDMNQQDADALRQKLMAHVDNYATLGDHPIVKASNNAVQGIGDIRESIGFFTPQLKILIEKKLDVLKEEVEARFDHLQAQGSESDERHAAGILLDATQKMLRLKNNKYLEVLQTSFFNNIFAIYDVFTGELVKAIFIKKPSLFDAINKSLTFSEILKAGDIAAIKESVIDEEIDTIRRKSYVEQFEYFENLFKIKLTAFESWPRFVEAGQRRNLMTHCGGVVTEQYLACCKKEKVKLPNDLKKGDKLKLSTKYIVGTTDVVISVCVMLAQTLWRKVCPTVDEQEQAAKHLIKTTYDLLCAEQWVSAEMIGAYAMEIPVRKQMDTKSARMLAINRCIALRAMDKIPAMEPILSSFDWSDASLEFRLAEAVLRERYAEAGELMLKIGKESELVDRIGYIKWPLFRDFRATTDFAGAYKKLYGIDFLPGVKAEADQARAETVEVDTAEDVRSNSGSNLPVAAAPAVSTEASGARESDKAYVALDVVPTGAPHAVSIVQMQKQNEVRSLD